jgi:prepilin signal peptidase PulO-like enzyme (type II secretory pathway)
MLGGAWQWIGPAVAAIAGLGLGLVAADLVDRWPRGEPLMWPPRRPSGPVGAAVACGCCGAATAAGGLFGITWTALSVGTLAVAFVPVLAIDVRHRLIPDLVVGPAAAIALPAAVLADPASWWVPVVCALAAGGFMFALWAARPAGMGLGDAKLAALMGAALGPSVLAALAVAFGAGALLGAALLLLLGGRARTIAVPFAPFLAAGSLAAPWLAPALMAWWAAGPA